MSNKDWAEVAAEEILDHPKMVNRDLTLSDYADAIRTALAGYAVLQRKDCLRYRVGEHDMVECKICDQIGHNDVLGDMYGINHREDCAYAAALAPQERT